MALVKSKATFLFRKNTSNSKKTQRRDWQVCLCKSLAVHTVSAFVGIFIAGILNHAPDTVQYTVLDVGMFIDLMKLRGAGRTSKKPSSAICYRGYVTS